jgi:hypothetical protein
MATTKQPYCKTVFPWLRANLGKHCTAGLTGQDHKALMAAVQTVELYSYCDDGDAVATAFGLLVTQMQPNMRCLAYHAIAHVTDWSFRGQLWIRAGLSWDDVRGVCANEPKTRVAASA